MKAGISGQNSGVLTMAGDKKQRRDAALRCPVCGKRVPWNKEEGYRVYCSRECEEQAVKNLEKLLEDMETEDRQNKKED